MDETRSVSQVSASPSAFLQQRSESIERRPSLSVQPSGDSLEEREPFSDSGETGQRCCFVRCMVSIYDFFASIFCRLFGKAENPSTDPKETQPDSDPAQEMQEIEQPNKVSQPKSEEPPFTHPLIGALGTDQPRTIANNFLAVTFSQTPDLTEDFPRTVYFEFGQKGKQGRDTQLWILYKLVTDDFYKHPGLNRSAGVVRCYLTFLNDDSVKEKITEQLGISLMNINESHYLCIQQILEEELLYPPAEKESLSPVTEPKSTSATPVQKPEPIAATQTAASTLVQASPQELAQRFVARFQNNGFQTELALGMFRGAAGRNQDWILYYMAKGKHFLDLDLYLYLIELTPRTAFFKKYGKNELYEAGKGPDSITGAEVASMMAIFAEGLPRQAKVAASSEPPVVQELRKAIKDADYSFLETTRFQFKDDLDPKMQVQLLYELASSQSKISSALEDIIVMYTIYLKSPYWKQVEKAMGKVPSEYEQSDIPRLANALKTLLKI